MQPEWPCPVEVLMHVPERVNGLMQCPKMWPFPQESVGGARNLAKDEERKPHDILFSIFDVVS